MDGLDFFGGEDGDAEGEDLVYAWDVSHVENFALARRFLAHWMSDAVRDDVVEWWRREVCGKVAPGGEGPAVVRNGII